jgi:flagellar biosynthesis protein
MMDTKAVALKYIKDLPAPFISARGKGRLAEKLLEIAEAEGIPIRIEGELAEVLFQVEVGSFIPEEMYEIIARLYTYVVEIQDGI